MKYSYLLLMMLMLADSAQAERPNESVILKIGDSLALHWKKDSPLHKYGDGKPLVKWSCDRLGFETMMWKAGDGILVVEYTKGAVMIIIMSYVITGAKGNLVAIFEVKEFNPTTGEMKIVVPNQALKQTGRANAAIKHP